MNDKEKEQFIKLIEDIKELRIRKSADYGNSWKLFGLRGVTYQIASKFIRIWNLTKLGKEPNNEALRDSYMDMANYAIMAVQLIDMGLYDDSLIKNNEDL